MPFQHTDQRTQRSVDMVHISRVAYLGIFVVSQGLVVQMLLLLLLISVQAGVARLWWLIHVLH